MKQQRKKKKLNFVVVDVIRLYACGNSGIYKNTPFTGIEKYNNIIGGQVAMDYDDVCAQNVLQRFNLETEKCVHNPSKQLLFDQRTTATDIWCCRRRKKKRKAKREIFTKQFTASELAHFHMCYAIEIISSIHTQTIIIIYV